ncbi:MAG: ABC transporter ATP-binding protein, partial [candidate division NC10 bacterium]|nr:ABC transporter ATP-binding protein [candidate division NC10 bacterium]
MDIAIRLQGVSFRYKKARDLALRGIDLKVPRGQRVGIMGPSGAGKSTLCFLLNGLIPHLIKGELEGEIEVEGKETRGCPVMELARSVGLVFQDFESQLFSTDVRLEVAFGPENLGLPREEIARRVDAALRFVGLWGFQGRQPATLSGGEKQRLAIASVISLNPSLLALDEPTSDLDPLGKEQVFQVAHELEREKGRTLFIVEHETEEMGSLDRILIMERGRIAADEPARQILTDARGLAARGVRPLELCEAFMGLVLREQTPLTVEEGLELWGRLGLSLDPCAYEALRAKEERERGGLGPEVLRARNLTFGYDQGAAVLEEISLSIQRGEFVALVGQNGSGKTTLAKHFNGLLLPGKGEVRVEGVDTREAGLTRLSRRVGYVFQNPDHQIFAESVKEDVAFGPRLAGLRGKELEDRVEAALAAVGLKEKGDWDPFSLTKGDRQKVAVASVLATQPEILIFDEPTTGLDYRELTAMMELITSLNRRGHTILMITHSMWLVAQYAQRVLVLHQGRLVLDGTPRLLFSQEG